MIFLGILLIIGGRALLLLPGAPSSSASRRKSAPASDAPLVIYLKQLPASPQSSNVSAWSTSDMDEWSNFNRYKLAVKAGRVHYHHHIYSGSATVRHEYVLTSGQDGFEKDFGTPPPRLPSGIKVGQKNQLLLEDKGG
jgi:hypothetical protein